MRPILTETCVSRGICHSLESHKSRTRALKCEDCGRAGTDPGPSQGKTSTHLDLGETPPAGTKVFSPGRSPAPCEGCLHPRAACAQRLPAPSLHLPGVTPPPTPCGRQQRHPFYHIDITSSVMVTEPLSVLMGSICNCNERNIKPC